MGDYAAPQPPPLVQAEGPHARTQHTHTLASTCRAHTPVPVGPTGLQGPASPQCSAMECAPPVLQGCRGFWLCWLWPHCWASPLFGQASDFSRAKRRVPVHTHARKACPTGRHGALCAGPYKLNRLGQCHAALPAVHRASHAFVHPPNRVLICCSSPDHAACLQLKRALFVPQACICANEARAAGGAARLREAPVLLVDCGSSSKRKGICSRCVGEVQAAFKKGHIFPVNTTHEGPITPTMHQHATANGRALRDGSGGSCRRRLSWKVWHAAGRRHSSGRLPSLAVVWRLHKLCRLPTLPHQPCPPSATALARGWHLAGPAGGQSGCRQSLR